MNRYEASWRLRKNDCRHPFFVNAKAQEGTQTLLLSSLLLARRSEAPNHFPNNKSMPGAVRPFERLRSRLRPARIDGDVREIVRDLGSC